MRNSDFLPWSAWLSLAAAAVLAGTIASAEAADVEPGYVSPVPPGDAWTLKVTPYFWASNFRGDVRVFPEVPAVHVDASFDDIWDNLNFATMGSVELRNQQFGFLADVVYVDLELDKSENVIPHVPSVSADFKNQLFTGTFSGFYALYNDSAFELDALGGARVWWSDTDLTVTFDDHSVHGKSAFSWVDPIIGLRGRIAINSRFSTTLYGDYGGFGVGSKNTWEAVGMVNYAFDNRWTGSLGYRYLSVDYEKDGHVFDIDMSGPVFAASYKF